MEGKWAVEFKIISKLNDITSNEDPNSEESDKLRTFVALAVIIPLADNPLSWFYYINLHTF